MGKPTVLTSWLVVHRYTHGAMIKNCAIYQATSRQEAIEKYKQTTHQTVWLGWEVKAIPVDQFQGMAFFIQMPKVNCKKHIINPVVDSYQDEPTAKKKP